MKRDGGDAAQLADPVRFYLVCIFRANRGRSVSLAENPILASILKIASTGIVMPKIRCTQPMADPLASCHRHLFGSGRPDDRLLSQLEREQIAQCYNAAGSAGIQDQRHHNPGAAPLLSAAQ